MSRFVITLCRGEQIDEEAVIGFDPPLRTFFLQGFPAEEEMGDPEIWLGMVLEEYPTLESLIEAARARGYVAQKLGRAQVIAMLAEAGHKYEPSIAERLGLIL
ncbi:hypothetical protein [Rhizobium binxianense]